MCTFYRLIINVCAVGSCIVLLRQIDGYDKYPGSSSPTISHAMPSVFLRAHESYITINHILRGGGGGLGRDMEFITAVGSGAQR